MATYFPQWTVRQAGVVAPDERLPWGQAFPLALQHVIAMFGATVLAPLLMGFDPNVAILMSGVGTLLFFVVVGGRFGSRVAGFGRRGRGRLVGVERRLGRRFGIVGGRRFQRLVEAGQQGGEILVVRRHGAGRRSRFRTAGKSTTRRAAVRITNAWTCRRAWPRRRNRRRPTLRSPPSPEPRL